MADKDQKKLISEEDLLKSLKELETVATGDKITKDPDPTVAEVVLAKSTIDAIKDGVKPETRRALDVSDILNDVVSVQAKYIDNALGTLVKSINSGAERDLSVVRVLGDLKKSIDANTAAIEKYGEAPAGKVKSAAREDVLNKSAGGDGKVTQLDPQRQKRQILNGLEMMAKSLPPGDQRGMDIMNVAIKFEATNQIEPRYIEAANKALKSAAS